MRGGHYGLGMRFSGLVGILGGREKGVPIRPKPLMPTLQVDGDGEMPIEGSLVEGAMIMQMCGIQYI